MKKYVVLLLLVSSIGFSQSINDYKYAIVPSKFEFLKEKDQFRMNTLTKMFMEKYGFVAYLDTDILPEEVASQNCNKVYVDVQSDGNMFRTTLIVVIKDCRNAVVYTSSPGKSKEKEYKIAYPQALREAFASFDKLGYKYNGSVTNVETVIVKTTNDGSTITKEVISGSSAKSEGNDLTAQRIENGFQLIDATSQVVLKIYPTSVNDVFIAENNLRKGILYLKNDNWIFEYYADGKLTAEVFKIKF